MLSEYILKVLGNLESQSLMSVKPRLNTSEFPLQLDERSPRS